jgi:hypothetical protein
MSRREEGIDGKEEGNRRDLISPRGNQPLRRCGRRERRPFFRGFADSRDNDSSISRARLRFLLDCGDFYSGN